VSVYATTWVWDHSESTGNARLVLLAIADAADANGDNAWPTQDKLAVMARVSVRTVRRLVAHLVELGELEVIEHAGGTVHTRDDRRPHLYRLIKMPGQNGRTTVSPRPSTGGQNQRHGRTKPAPRADTVVPYTSFKNTLKEQEQPSGGVADATPEASPALPEEEHMRRKDSQDELALFEADPSPAPQPVFNGGTLVAVYLASYARHFGGARPGKATIGQVSRAAKALVESGDWSEIELTAAADALGATAFAGLERQAMMARKSSRGPSKIVPHGDETWSTPAAAQARLVEDDEFMSRWLAEQSARDQVTA
jgi:hypothetical protein